MPTGLKKLPIGRCFLAPTTWFSGKELLYNCTVLCHCTVQEELGELDSWTSGQLRNSGGELIGRGPILRHVSLWPVAPQSPRVARLSKSPGNLPGDYIRAVRTGPWREPPLSFPLPTFSGSHLILQLSWLLSAPVEHHSSISALLLLLRSLRCAWPALLVRQQRLTPHLVQHCTVPAGWGQRLASICTLCNILW